MLTYLLCIIYLWYSYKVFYTKTYGSFIFIGLILGLCFSLISSVIMYLFTRKSSYLYIPLIPHIIYTYWDKKTMNMMKKKRIIRPQKVY